MYNDQYIGKKKKYPASGVWSFKDVSSFYTKVPNILNLNDIKNNKLLVSASQLQSFGYFEDGVYLINLPTVGPTLTYCLLDSKWDGGGWMMAMKATTSTTFNYAATYWTTINTLNPTDVTRNNGDAKFEVFNRFLAKDIMAVWPDITASGAGSISTVTDQWTWLENNFNAGTRNQSLTSFFASPSPLTFTSGVIGGSGCYIRNAKSFTGWKSGVFSSQNAVQFYGFNYTNYNYPTMGSARVRWGFGWNNDGEGLWPSSYTGTGNEGSNDVSGGIGMDSSFGSYSAGDNVGSGSWQDTTGLNRSARVEIYVR